MVPLDANASLSLNTHGHQCCKLCFVSILNSCTTLAVMTDLLLLDVCLFLFLVLVFCPLQPPSLVSVLSFHMLKQNKNKKNPARNVRSLSSVFCTLSMLLGCIKLFLTQPTVGHRRADSMRSTKTNGVQGKNEKGLLALVNMQCILPLPHGDLLLDCCSV